MYSVLYFTVQIDQLALDLFIFGKLFSKIKHKEEVKEIIFNLYANSVELKLSFILYIILSMH